MIALIVVMMLASAFTSPAAHARDGFRRSCLEGLCIGGALGWLFGRHVEVVPADSPPPSAVPECYREVPEQMVQRWYPGSPYPVYERIPAHHERIPCPRYR